MPMHGGRFRQFVGYVKAHAVSLNRLDDGAWRAAIIAPAFRFQARGKLVIDFLGGEVEHLNSID